jgi:hypothetical protein
MKEKLNGKSGSRFTIVNASLNFKGNSKTGLRVKNKEQNFVRKKLSMMLSAKRMYRQISLST